MSKLLSVLLARSALAEFSILARDTILNLLLAVGAGKCPAHAVHSMHLISVAT